MALLKRAFRSIVSVFALLVISLSAGCAGSSNALPGAPSAPQTHTLLGVLIHTESCNFDACVAAVKDLGLDIVAIGFVPHVYPMSHYDKWLAAIPQSKVLALIALPTSTRPPSPEKLAKYASAVAERYPGIMYFEILNEPNVPRYYPGGMNPELYARYYSLSAEAIRAVNPLATVMGPVTKDFDNSYIQVMSQQSVLAVHPYGSTPANVGQAFANLRVEGYSNYWASEWGLVDPVAMWKACEDAGCGGAIYYQLQDSPDSRGSGLMDLNGNPRPSYRSAKSFLRTRTVAQPGL